MATPNLSSQPGNRYSNPANFAPGVHSVEPGQPSVTIGMTMGLSATTRAEMHDAVTQGMTMGLTATIASTVSSGMTMGLSAVLSGLAPVPPDPPDPPIACQDPEIPAYTPSLVSYAEPSERTGS